MRTYSHRFRTTVANSVNVMLYESQIINCEITEKAGYLSWILSCKTRCVMKGMFLSIILQQSQNISSFIIHWWKCFRSITTKCRMRILYVGLELKNVLTSSIKNNVIKNGRILDVDCTIC